MTGAVLFGGAACLALVVFIGQHALWRVIHARIAPRHRDLQYVLDHRRPPDHWGASVDHDQVARLDMLIDYVARTRLVADETTRGLLRHELGEIREEWLRRC